MKFLHLVHSGLVLSLIGTACTTKKMQTKIVKDSSNSCTIQSENAEQTVLVCLKDGESKTLTVKNGVNGKDGANGNDGTNGKNGTDGTNGNDGKNGSDGKDGSEGKPGPVTQAEAVYPITVKNVSFDSKIEGVPLEDVVCSYDIESQAPDLADRQVLWAIKETPADGAKTIIHEVGFAKLNPSHNHPGKFQVLGSRHNNLWLAAGSNVSCEIKLMNKGFNPATAPQGAIAVAIGESEPQAITTDKRDITVKQVFHVTGFYNPESKPNLMHVIWQNDGTLIAYEQDQSLEKPIVRIKNVNQVVAHFSRELAFERGGRLYSLSFDAKNQGIVAYPRGEGSIEMGVSLLNNSVSIMLTKDGRLLSWSKGLPNQDIQLVGWSDFAKEKYKKIKQARWKDSLKVNHEAGLLAVTQSGKLRFLSTADNTDIMYAPFLNAVNGSVEASGAVEELETSSEEVFAVTHVGDKAVVHSANVEALGADQIKSQAYGDFQSFQYDGGGIYLIAGEKLEYWNGAWGGSSSALDFPVTSETVTISETESKTYHLRKLMNFSVSYAALLSVNPLNDQSECNEPAINCAVKLWDMDSTSARFITGVKQAALNSEFTLLLKQPVNGASGGYDVVGYDYNGNVRNFQSGASSILAEPWALRFLVVMQDHSAYYYDLPKGEFETGPNLPYVVTHIPVSEQFTDFYKDFGLYLRVGKTAWNIIGSDSRVAPFPAGMKIEEDKQTLEF